MLSLCPSSQEEEEEEEKWERWEESMQGTPWGPHGCQGRQMAAKAGRRLLGERKAEGEGLRLPGGD